MQYLPVRQHRLAESIPWNRFLWVPKKFKIPPQKEDGKANLTADGELEKGKGYRLGEGKPEMSGNPSTGKTNGEFQESGEKTAS